MGKTAEFAIQSPKQPICIHVGRQNENMKVLEFAEDYKRRPKLSGPLDIVSNLLLTNDRKQQWRLHSLNELCWFGFLSHFYWVNSHRTFCTQVFRSLYLTVKYLRTRCESLQV